MDSLLKEIENKEKEIFENRKNRKKYFKRGELNQDENRKREIKQVETEKTEKTPTTHTQETTDEKNDVLFKMNMTKQEVMIELRKCNAPIKLFGETDMDSFRRLKIAQLENTNQKKGLRNEFQAALEKVEQNLIKNMSENTENTEKINEFELFEIEHDLIELKKISPTTLYGDFGVDSDFITQFCKNILNLWAEDISSRPINVRKTTKCMLESARYDQTKTYLAPLFERLRNRTLTDHIRDCLVKVVQSCLCKDYVKANDVYLQLAVGNAPWPIGVTQVCIHARTGRERIANNQIAHVLNDDTQRKYIQAVKRLLTACQNYFPAEQL